MLIVETAVSTPIRIAADAVSDTTTAEDRFDACSINNNLSILFVLMIQNDASMTHNSRLLFCSRDMHRFMEANGITSIQALFEISIDELVKMSNFPHRLLKEWVSLRDKFNLLCEN
jgi:hypothetical protein